MAIFSTYIAGNSVIAQDTDIPVERVGGSGGVLFDPFKFEASPRWFHFAVPTPTTIKDQDVSILRVMILFKTTGSVEIDRVDLWDGWHGLLKTSDLHLSGDYVMRVVGGENVVEMPPLGENEFWGIRWGLGVSIHVDPGADYGEIRFASVGADFEAEA